VLSVEGLDRIIAESSAYLWADQNISLMARPTTGEQSLQLCHQRRLGPNMVVERQFE
jgi:hypothetical protein